MTDRIEPCDVWELARRRSSVEGEVAVRQMPRLAEQLQDPADVLSFRFSGDRDQRGRPAALLELGGTVHAVCDRCGQPVAIPMDENQQFFFVADEAELGRLPIDEAPEEPLLGSPRFDLAALIEDQAILALPISPRHEGCQSSQERIAGEVGDDGLRRPFAILNRLKGRSH